ncbi:hypothetical protein PsorP6_001491 [Peronosclerospora sorghi]|uniref:Uncharacterized protein n=1 Tax=Peronosclerospora sorghi TaxID=230839 RepID=A0ACC0WVN5_9STRA|nr:hypothetical protein PsorP6_001491 [Peronosclerospora sorghi]
MQHATARMHPAIGCVSFLDDPNDCEVEYISRFLTKFHDVENVARVPNDVRRLGSCCCAVLGSTRMLCNVPGVQAECVRVPYADINSFKLHSGVSDDKALVGVAITSGPIGLQAAHWCKLRG